MSVKTISSAWMLLFVLFSASSVMASDVSSEREEEGIVSSIKTSTKDLFDSFYRKAEAAQPSPDDYQKSCVVLDDEVTMLLPLTYRYVPGFYDDPYNAFSIWMGTVGVLTVTDVEVLDVPLWYGFLGISGYKRHAEEKRIHKANMRIEALRRVKARKRCFEVF